MRHQGKRLTERHREVLRLYGQGYTRKEIAEKLVLSEETVKTHTRNARAVLRARTVTHAVALGIVFDLI